MNEHVVKFKVLHETKVKCKPSELSDALFDLDIPENEIVQLQYIENAFQIRDSAGNLIKEEIKGETVSEYVVQIPSVYKTKVQSEFNELSDALFELDIPENEEFKYIENSFEIIS